MSKSTESRAKRVHQLKADFTAYQKVVRTLTNLQTNLKNNISGLESRIKFIKTEFSLWRNAYGYVQFRLRDYTHLQLLLARKNNPSPSGLGMMPRHDPPMNFKSNKLIDRGNYAERIRT